jgi:G3E family GTPase
MTGDARVPINLITGFLGAGKTTLLNRLLQGGFGDERVAVVVNDFGRVNVDALLIQERTGKQDEGLLSLPNGCICCTLAGGLLSGLDELLGGGFDRIIMETSGLTRVCDLARLLEAPGLTDRGVLRTVIAVVDTVRFAQIRPVIVSLDEQVQSANVVLLNRRDLAGGGRVATTETEVRKLNPAADILVSEHCAVPFARIRLAEEARIAADTAGTAVDGWRGFEVRFSLPVDADSLRAVLTALPANLYRLKGFLRAATGETLHVQWAGGSTIVDLWPNKVPADARDVLVAIGSDALDAETLADAFASVNGGSVEQTHTAHGHDH